VSPVKYELGFYIPEDDILHRTVLFAHPVTRETSRVPFRYGVSGLHQISDFPPRRSRVEAKLSNTQTSDR
jgi:hypothetical protein